MSLKISPVELRHKIRRGEHNSNTSGFCHGYLQCNLVMLPKDWAADFLKFCQLNQKPCPLISVSENPGDTHLNFLAEDLDLRTDIPSYRIFKDGVMTTEVNDITDYWRDDLVTFALGCSFSFEESLQADGLDVRNITEQVNVPMYRTNIACTPAGPFNGNMVVSMRPFVARDAIRAIQICTRFPAVHGAPVHFGDPQLIGIDDLAATDYGDAVTLKEHEQPVFWACGVTPQVALEQAKPPFCITHSPGCMLVTDIPNSRLALM
ncbi:putative hydro-lyase [Thalassotalea sp. ND16A]|uniref:putative hydro-lyase n=1 Tax=Thalassotalea sp. ND16A TaxID=1535422 RepID=UPI00051A27DD|nr:putative hydro-lyase [Thalassotalea sp. ND16A]KGJ96047.1 hypothetical protein ND16A_1106 [Thalassotalea sp. ND16A]